MLTRLQANRNKEVESNSNPQAVDMAENRVNSTTSVTFSSPSTNPGIMSCGSNYERQVVAMDAVETEIQASASVAVVSRDPGVIVSSVGMGACSVGSGPSVDSSALRVYNRFRELGAGFGLKDAALAHFVMENVRREEEKEEEKARREEERKKEERRLEIEKLRIEEERARRKEEKQKEERRLEEERARRKEEKQKEERRLEEERARRKEERQREEHRLEEERKKEDRRIAEERRVRAVSYTHLRAHETELHLVCRLLLEKKKN